MWQRFNDWGRRTDNRVHQPGPILLRGAVGSRRRGRLKGFPQPGPILLRGAVGMRPRGAPARARAQDGTGLSGLYSQPPVDDVASWQRIKGASTLPQFKRASFSLASGFVDRLIDRGCTEEQIWSAMQKAAAASPDLSESFRLWFEKQSETGAAGASPAAAPSGTASPAVAAAAPTASPVTDPKADKNQLGNKLVVKGLAKQYLDQIRKAASVLEKRAEDEEDERGRLAPEKVVPFDRWDNNFLSDFFPATASHRAGRMEALARASGVPSRKIPFSVSNPLTFRALAAVAAALPVGYMSNVRHSGPNLKLPPVHFLAAVLASQLASVGIQRSGMKNLTKEIRRRNAEQLNPNAIRTSATVSKILGPLGGYHAAGRGSVQRAIQDGDPVSYDKLMTVGPLAAKPLPGGRLLGLLGGWWGHSKGPDDLEEDAREGAGSFARATG